LQKVCILDQATNDNKLHKVNDMKNLANKIAKITGKKTNDPIVIATATAWVNAVRYLLSIGFTHDQADSFVYDLFKNDTDRFAEFCKLYI